MDSNRQQPSKRSRKRDPLDRRVDQLIETGRQFVDGVAGNRPGRRRPINSSWFSDNSFETVGQWFGNKLDWFLEDEDDWMEPWQMDRSAEDRSSNKKPLSAISRRSPQSRSYTKSAEEVSDVNDWPDESSFRVERWERPQESQRNQPRNVTSDARQPKRTATRKLPRSSRKRA